MSSVLGLDGAQREQLLREQEYEMQRIQQENQQALQ